MMDATTASDVIFSTAVKAVQTAKGSRAQYARKADAGGFATAITPDLAAWLAERDSFYLATASAEGQPYMQHRGGPPGFIHVLDEHTLAWADYHGNRQYVSTGNLAENDRAMLFLMDHDSRTRIKIWGRARVVSDDPALLARLMPAGYRARPEQVIVFEVSVWDPNCSQHIPRLLHADDVGPLVARLQARVKALEAALAAQGG